MPNSSPSRVVRDRYILQTKPSILITTFIADVSFDLAIINCLVPLISYLNCYFQIENDLVLSNIYLVFIAKRIL